MSHRKWDVVFISAFPNQDDKTKFTKRPGIILSLKGKRVTVCPITTKLKQKYHYSHTIEVIKGTHEQEVTGLLETSLIVLDRIEVINDDKIDFKIGTCSDLIKVTIGDLLKRQGIKL